MSGVVKAVKKVAPVAIAAAGMYYGMNMPGGYNSFGSLVRGAGEYISKNLLSLGGLAMSGASAISQRKYGKQAANNLQNKTAAENKAIEARAKYNNLLQKRQRTAALREQRINVANTEARTTNLGLGTGGTSGFSGAVSSATTTTAANLGNINVAEDVGNQITGFNIAAANYGSDANQAQSKSNMWSNMNTLGQSVVGSKLFAQNQLNFTIENPTV